jgi:transposase InsO family protein
MADSGIVFRVSRSGNMWDNAAMESFFSSLKTECTARKSILPGTRQGQMCSTTPNGSAMPSGVIRRSDTSAQLSSNAGWD